MNKGAALALLGLATGAALLLTTRRAQATPLPLYQQPIYGGAPPAPAPTQPGTLFDFFDYYVDDTDYYAEPYEMMPTINPAQANVAAFLEVIRTGEGTRGENGYRTLYGGALFTAQDYAKTGYTDFETHPYFAGWPGVRLPDAMCISAGKQPGCITTAAGAYQFLSSTWTDAQHATGVFDFSPASQDAAAIFLIQRRGALVDVQQGHFESAIKKVAKEWASMPFSPYGQPVISLTSAQDIYLSAGGFIA